MLHRTRVSAWVPILGTWAEMLLAGQAAILYYGVLMQDPNTAVLAGLAAVSSGGVTLVILLGLWMGVTLNVANCPAMYQAAPKRYPDLSALNQDTVSIYVAPDRTEWKIHYPGRVWIGLSKMIQAGYNHLPYRVCYEHTRISRQDWSRLKLDIVRAGLASKRGKEVYINDDGVRAIYKWAAAALPSREYD